jgi:hypothetical protein
MAVIQDILWWLSSETHLSGDGRYRHQLLTEDPDGLRRVLDALRSYVDSAHRDATSHYRRLAGISLDPLAEPAAPDPAKHYPRQLPLPVLTGYFGEIFAGLVAEHYAPLGENGWEVPAFLFRFHTIAFQQLESARQDGPVAEDLPGRTGDDCLAFLRDERGRIVRIMYCEAKCCRGHDAHLIVEAHQKVSRSAIVDILQLVEILEDRDDDRSAVWVEALKQLWLRGPAVDVERCDLVCYVCGRAPSRTGRTSWLPSEVPHRSYTAGRRLEAVEVHLADVERVVRLAYRLEAAP